VPDKATIRVAAAGDVHCTGERKDRKRIERAFATLEDVDLVLLAGDLTTHGEPAQAAMLGEVAAAAGVPVAAVLGNHDWHANRVGEVMAALEASGVRVLERGPLRCEIRGVDVGVAGTKGFVGGFPDHSLPDFGEPSLRQVYAETTREVDALERGLREIEDTDVRLVLLHYAPTTTTLGAEPNGIWVFLGSDRLARPILDHAPDLVLHGHAHAGAFEGFVGAVPVYNVAVHVTGRAFWVFDLEPGGRRAGVERVVERRAE
jgi:Icc-related predicted phosphoesterase